MYPVMLDVRGRSVLVVGGGPVAARKAVALVDEGAVVTVVAPEISPEMANVVGVQVRGRTFSVTDLEGMWLVVAATDDAVVQQEVFEAATARRIWVNAADDPTRCSFILPAVHRDGSVIVAVSTSGSSPALAGWLRTRLAAALPSRISEIAQSLAGRRAQMRERGESTESIDWHPIIEQMVKETDARHAEPRKREIAP